jgi:hypothetical protein
MALGTLIGEFTTAGCDLDDDGPPAKPADSLQNADRHVSCVHFAAILECREIPAILGREGWSAGPSSDASEWITNAAVSSSEFRRHPPESNRILLIRKGLPIISCSELFEGRAELSWANMSAVPLIAVVLAKSLGDLRELGLWVAVTAGALTVLIWGGLRIRAWFHEESGPAESMHEMLVQYRELQREGKLSEEEYRSIKRRLAPGLGDAHGVLLPDPSVRADSAEDAAPAATPVLLEGTKETSRVLEETDDSR